jgi:hypothetical protein
MDPQAAWQRLIDAYASRNWIEAIEAAEDLRERLLVSE